MRFTVADSINAFDPSAWNRLAGGSNPFVRHEFLSALETHRCVGEGTGWLPQHLAVHDGERLVGAAPQYLKYNSYGEFVFDWAWADAYERAGLRYYPKLVIAVPYTPAAGPRLLALAGASGDSAINVLVDGSLAYAREQGVSSLHWLFTEPADTRRLEAAGLLRRTGCQYHWHNPGYRDFHDFLDSLTSKRRKEIRRERRAVREAGLRIEVLKGSEVTEAQWTHYYHFYRSIFDRKWGMPTLTAGFFRQIGEALGENVILVLARHEGRYIAGSLCLRGTDALFGRHWGCSRYVPNLHFELCYYQTIEYCIRNGLSRFEAGAQGEHKISRGFLPVPTMSMHWLAHKGFRITVSEFLRREAEEMRRSMRQLAEQSPFRSASPNVGSGWGEVRGKHGGANEPTKATE